MNNGTYPFCAIVGQEEMKTALILNMVMPEIGGVLIKGEKGTAKSTAVRALQQVMPVRKARDCRFRCDPERPETWCEECQKAGPPKPEEIREDRLRVVDLPISATLDRVVGSIDLEEMVKSGDKAFQPGLLAEANRNILYVDEVNLLEDHIVDVLLDAAAMGVNRVERESVSYAHPSRFVLVGTMNPEEGELRPQLLDRFGLLVQVRGEYAPEKRMEIMRRRLAYERDPAGFRAAYEAEEAALGRRIEDASKRLDAVRYDEGILSLIAEISGTLEVDGHRADITMLKTAAANAAFAGRNAVSREDVRLAARLALPHRMRRLPFEEMELDLSRVDELVDRAPAGAE